MATRDAITEACLIEDSVCQARSEDFIVEDGLCMVGLGVATLRVDY